MTFSVYASERKAIERIQKENNLKSPFDVIRMMAFETKLIRSGEFRVPKAAK